MIITKANADEAKKHIRELFPDNYYYFDTGHDGLFIDYNVEKQLFLDELNKAGNEHDIQTYIKQGKKLFIPYSIIVGYPFHNAMGALLFSECPLGEKYKADYCLCGNNSDGWHIVFVELEAPNEPYILKTSRTEAECVRKGIAQLREWKAWLDDNRLYFLRETIPFERYGIKISSACLHYCLVVSRREYMTAEAQTLRSQYIAENRNFRIMTYDRIADNIAEL